MCTEMLCFFLLLIEGQQALGVAKFNHYMVYAQYLLSNRKCTTKHTPQLQMACVHTAMPLASYIVTHNAELPHT